MIIESESSSFLRQRSSLGLCESPVRRSDACRDGPRPAVANTSPVNLHHWRKLAHGARREDLISAVGLCEGDATFLANEVELAAAQRNDCGAGDARQARGGLGREHDAVLDDEDVAGIGLAHKALEVQHEGVGCASDVGLDLRKDVVELHRGEKGERVRGED